MRGRCLNANGDTFAYYGGRGIRIDPRWDDFEAFLEDMGERPPGLTLDRIDTNGDYTKTNCRWASRAEQSRNTRRTKFVTLDGKQMCVADAATMLGMHSQDIYRRVRTHKVSHQEALDYFLSRRTTSLR